MAAQILALVPLVVARTGTGRQGPDAIGRAHRVDDTATGKDRAVGRPTQPEPGARALPVAGKAIVEHDDGITFRVKNPRHATAEHDRATILNRAGESQGATGQHQREQAIPAQMKFHETIVTLGECSAGPGRYQASLVAQAANRMQRPRACSGTLATAERKTQQSGQANRCEIQRTRGTATSSTGA